MAQCYVMFPAILESWNIIVRKPGSLFTFRCELQEVTIHSKENFSSKCIAIVYREYVVMVASNRDDFEVDMESVNSLLILQLVKETFSVSFNT